MCLTSIWKCASSSLYHLQYLRFSSTSADTVSWGRTDSWCAENLEYLSVFCCSWSCWNSDPHLMWEHCPACSSICLDEYSQFTSQHRPPCTCFWSCRNDNPQFMSGHWWIYFWSCMDKNLQFKSVHCLICFKGNPQFKSVDFPACLCSKRDEMSCCLLTSFSRTLFCSFSDEDPYFLSEFFLILFCSSRDKDSFLSTALCRTFFFSCSDEKQHFLSALFFTCLSSCRDANPCFLSGLLRPCFWLTLQSLPSNIGQYRSSTLLEFGGAEVTQ